MALIRPRRDRRTIGYAALAIGFVVLALVRGQPLDLVVAAPFAAVLLLGLRDVRPVDVTCAVDFESATSFEGDEIHGTIELIRPRGMITTISVDNRAGWSAVTPEPALIWTIGPSGDKVIARSITDGCCSKRARLNAS